MGNARVWLFRILVLAAGGFLTLTWFMPWWAGYAEKLHVDVAIVYPYGLVLQHMGGYETLAKGAEMPGWFAYIMWAYLGLALAVLLFSLFAKQKELNLFGKVKISLPRFLVLGVGVSYVLVAIIAVIYMAMRIPNFYDMPLQGSTHIYLNPMLGGVTMVNGLEIGYYLACVAGILLILLALFGNKITGRS